MARNIRVNIRYRTEAERIRRILPPPLEMDDSPEVIVDWLLNEPDDSRRSVFLPGPYYESGTFVSAKFAGHSGMWEISMPLNQDWGRHRGRELDDLTKKDGVIAIERDGDRVRASLTRRGKTLTSIETFLTDQVQHPRFWMRQFGYAGFRYRYSLAPDWREGPLEGPKVELWRLNGSDDGYPTSMVMGQNSPVACDISRTKFELPDMSCLDPLCEFPPLEILGVTYHEGDPNSRRPISGGIPLAAAGYQHHCLAEVDAAAFDPWALYKFDRPIFEGIPLLPRAWPQDTTALKLTPGDIEAYRLREALVLRARCILSIEYLVTPEVHRRTLPPGCVPGNVPMIMVMALQIGQSDVSTLPFNELWLFSHCVVAGKPAWYALANIVGSGGDVVFGRDAFGYPSKQGSVDIDVSQSEFRIGGTRLGREFFEVSGKINSSAALRKDTQIRVIGLKAFPRIGDDGPGAKLTVQPWTVQNSNAISLSPDNLILSVPNTASPGVIGKRDPWFELQPLRIESATIASGTIRIMPASYANEVPNWEPYFLERCDGCLSPGEALLGGGNDTFIVQQKGAVVP